MVKKSSSMMALASEGERRVSNVWDARWWAMFRISFLVVGSIISIIDSVGVAKALESSFPSSTTPEVVDNNDDEDDDWIWDLGESSVVKNVGVMERRLPCLEEIMEPHFLGTVVATKPVLNPFAGMV